MAGQLLGRAGGRFGLARGLVRYPAATAHSSTAAGDEMASGQSVKLRGLMGDDKGDLSVYWAFAVATAAGLFMGCWFRIPALIASSVLVSIVVVGVGLGTGVSGTRIALATLALACAHQGGYVAGLLLHHFWSRLKHKGNDGQIGNH